MFCINIFVINYQKVKDNWNDYKCSPLVMPFAGSFGVDPVTNFTGCITAMQGGFMEIFMQPIDYVISLLGDSATEFMGAIQNIRSVLDNVRTFLSSILESIFGILRHNASGFRINSRNFPAFGDSRPRIDRLDLVSVCDRMAAIRAHEGVFGLSG